MPGINFDEIKYYPDRFYVRLDGFDTTKLTDFITQLDLKQEQAIFIHEYYHYLTNIVTFAGVRQFHANFCDRFRLVTIITNRVGLDGFPLKDNKMPDCEDDIAYWNKVNDIINEDDIDFSLVDMISQSANKKFEIVNVSKEILSESIKIGGTEHHGKRFRIRIEIDGLINRQSFVLTYGALDEFLNSAIDEYMFSNDIAEIDPSFLSQRPFYPYACFDELLKYYGIEYPSAFEKILIAYYALNCYNPSLALIELLETMREGGYELFQQNPEAYLLGKFNKPSTDQLSEIRAFSEQCAEQGRIHMAQALRYYGDRFYLANQLKEEDFFYFIRPFFVKHEDKVKFKQQFLLALARIIQVFTPPLILEGGLFKYVDKLTTMGEATTHIIATYEIFESLKSNRIAKRPQYLKGKYSFPENDPDCDDISKFKLPPISGSYRLALNEVGLYRLYLLEANPELRIPNGG